MAQPSAFQAGEGLQAILAASRSLLPEMRHGN